MSEIYTIFIFIHQRSGRKATITDKQDGNQLRVVQSILSLSFFISPINMVAKQTEQKTIYKTVDKNT